MFPLGFLSGLKVHEIRVGYAIELVVSGVDWGAGHETGVQIDGPCMLTDPDGMEHRVELAKPDSIPALFRLHSRIIGNAFAQEGALRAWFDDGSVLTVPTNAEVVAWRVHGPEGEIGDGTTLVGGPRDEVSVWHPWFELALAQAIAWCAPRANLADPANSLRSASLRPKLLGADSGLDVAGVVENRKYDLAASVATEVQSAADLQGGRLLAYFPDEELADGAAEAESAGFFDGYDAPPWDTWVALLAEDRERPLHGPCLVSWVPPAFLTLAAAGMEVSAVENIRWLEDTDVPLRAQLRERGVIG